MSASSRRQAEEEVRSWGFRQVFTWTDAPNTHYNPHSHPVVTAHLILSGSMTVGYPEDKPEKKETVGPGGRLDVPARKLHEVWMGKEGCTYVVGE